VAERHGELPPRNQQSLNLLMTHSRRRAHHRTSGRFKFGQAAVCRPGCGCPFSSSVGKMAPCRAEQDEFAYLLLTGVSQRGNLRSTMVRMTLYRYGPDGLEAVQQTSLVAAKIRERQDLQRVLREGISVLGEDLLVITEEYGQFEDSRRRVDLLALDRTGTLVVIELKRTEDGGHMELRALRYAAMVSTMTPDHLIDTYADANHLDIQEARSAITEWVGRSLDALPDQVRIILVSQDFSAEITSTVLWLNGTYNTDISCYRIVPYQLGTDILFDLQQIIPLPEARNFQIQQRQKGAAATAARAENNNRDYTRYDLDVGEVSFSRLSKQAAVKAAVQHLHRAGVPLVTIKSVTRENRWLPVHPAAGEKPEEAFRREYPASSPLHRWHDLGITDGDGVAWTMPCYGGADTEKMLSDLARVSERYITLKWAPSLTEAADDAGN
jgi:hypothetical protein